MLCRAVLSVALGGLSPIGRRWVANLPPPRFFHVPLPNLNLKIFRNSRKSRVSAFHASLSNSDVFDLTNFTSNDLKTSLNFLFWAISEILDIDMRWCGIGIWKSQQNSERESQKFEFRIQGFLYPEILGPKSPWFGFLGSWNFHFRDSGF